MNDALPQDAIAPFAVHDCAMLVMTTKLHAQDLREFRDGLRHAPESSLYHHFWGRLLRPEFDEPEYSNDFASWAFRGLGEKALAERLSVINPSDFPDMEMVRDELIEVVEATIDENPHTANARVDYQFYFTQAQLVVFDTGIRLPDPASLAAATATLPTSAIYYHFIDARRRTDDRVDDFTRWLRAWDPDCGAVCTQLVGLDPYFSSLGEIRRQVSAILAPLAAAEASELGADEQIVADHAPAPAPADDAHPAAGETPPTGRASRSRGRKSS